MHIVPSEKRAHEVAATDESFTPFFSSSAFNLYIGMIGCILLSSLVRNSQ